MRFSNDKRPFKTEIGTVWYRQGAGRSGGSGVLYFHLAARGSFGAVAFYMPDPELLDSIREAIRVRPEAFRSVEDTLAARGLHLSTESRLTRMPRGFEDLRGSDVAGAIRLKSFVVSRPIDREVVETPALVDHLADMAADGLPLLRFGWRAIDEARGA